MIDKNKVNEIIDKYEISSFKWITPKEIVVAQWVRLKCMFGCPSYGKNASCPPNTPSITECREFFNEYTHGLILHFNVRLDNSKGIGSWSKKTNKKLLELEREIFLHTGYYKAFLLFLDECRLCSECVTSRVDCKNKIGSRPSPEGFGVDVFATVRKYDLPIDVLTKSANEMNRYAFLLID